MRFSSIFLSALSLISYSVSALPASRSPTLPGSPSGSTPARVPSLLPWISRSEVSELNEGNFFEGITLDGYNHPDPYILLVIAKIPPITKEDPSVSKVSSYDVIPCFTIDNPRPYHFEYLGGCTTEEVGKLHGDLRKVYTVAPLSAKIRLLDVKIKLENMQYIVEAVKFEIGISYNRLTEKMDHSATLNRQGAGTWNTLDETNVFGFLVCDEA